VAPAGRIAGLGVRVLARETERVSVVEGAQEGVQVCAADDELEREEPKRFRVGGEDDSANGGQCAGGMIGG
jgi:hypothetical protein